MLTRAQRNMIVREARAYARRHPDGTVYEVGEYVTGVLLDDDRFVDATAVIPAVDVSDYAYAIARQIGGTDA